MDQERISDYTIPNVSRAMRALEVLAQNPAGLSLKVLAETLNIPVNSSFRICTTLHELGYLIRDPESKFFRISKKLFPIACSAIGEKDLVELATDPMRRLKNDVHESVLLCTLLPKESRAVLVMQIPGDHFFRFIFDIGSNVALHLSAGGKCLMAFGEPDESEAILKKLKYPRFTSKTISGKRAYLKELEDVRSKGYGVDRGEWMEECHCVGVPIFNTRGIAEAALYIIGPSSRLREENFEEVAEKLKLTSQEISELMRRE